MPESVLYAGNISHLHPLKLVELSRVELHLWFSVNEVQNCNLWSFSSNDVYPDWHL